MRFLLVLMLALIAGSEVFAQNDTVSYYMDYDWAKCKPVHAMYFRVAWKEGKWWRVRDHYLDNGVLQMDGIFSVYEHDSFKMQQGTFLYYHHNGVLSERSHYINGELDGISKVYDSTGFLIDSGRFVKNMPVKEAIGWYSSGQIKNKGLYDENGSGAGEKWYYFDNGILADYGKIAPGVLQDSIWTHFNRKGKIACKDYYEKGKLIKRQCFDENEHEMNSSCDDKPAASFSKKEFRKQFRAIKDRLLFADVNKGLRELKGQIHGQLVFELCVDEDGKITFELKKGVHPLIDKFFLAELNNLPKVTPAIINNRPAKTCDLIAIPID